MDSPATARKARMAMSKVRSCTFEILRSTVRILRSQQTKATITVILIMKMDQGWVVPKAKGVNITKDIKQNSMIMFRVRCSRLNVKPLFLFNVLGSKLKPTFRSIENR